MSSIAPAMSDWSSVLNACTALSGAAPTPASSGNSVASQSEIPCASAYVCNRAIEVSPILFETTRFAIALAEETGGAFDPTMGAYDAVHVDARQCMITDDRFGKASPLRDLTTARLEEIARPSLNSGRVVVMGGYIGATKLGMTTTLGRGGSDYSAAIAGAALNAEEIQIWTDVDGLMTADPRIVAEAWKVKEISFEEASELAYFGARVLHPLTLLPAVEQNIPVYILNSRKPKGTGTRITRQARPCRNLIKSIACKRGITIVTVSSSRMLMAYGFLKALFEVFDRHHTSVDMVATSEVSVSLTLDNVSWLDAIVEDLKSLGEVEVATNMALICLVGNNLKYTPGVARRAFGSIADINILMVSHGASNINFSFIVDQNDADSAIQKLRLAASESAVWRSTHL